MMRMKFYYSQQNIDLQVDIDSIESHPSPKHQPLSFNNHVISKCHSNDSPRDGDDSSIDSPHRSRCIRHNDDEPNKFVY